MEELNCMKIATLSGGKWDDTLESNCRVDFADRYNRRGGVIRK